MKDSERDEYLQVVGPKFATLLHDGACQPSEEECNAFRVAGLSSDAEELTVTWDESSCVDGVQQLGASAEPSEVASTYELTFPLG